MSKGKYLHVQDIRGLEYGDCTLPSDVCRTSNLDFDVACAPPSEDYDLEMHVQTVQNVLAQVTGKPSVRIRIYFEKDGDEDREAFLIIGEYESMLEQLRKLEGLEVLELYSYMESTLEQQIL